MDIFTFSCLQNPLDPCPVQSYVVGDARPNQCGLESHHSHFLLFDDHLFHENPAVILTKRAQWEKSLQLYSFADGEKIPLVLILVEGGPSSIRTICQALLTNTPVLIIDVSSVRPDRPRT